MIRSIRESIRVVVPHGGVLALMIRSLAFVELMVWSFTWYVRDFLFEDPIFAEDQIRDIFVPARITVVALVCGGYALYRALVFHPFARREYRDWLASTTWTADKPMPLGPICLVWQDIVLLAAITLTAWSAGERMLAGPVAFLSVYLSVLTVVLARTGVKKHAYALAFAAAAIAGFVTNIPFALLALALLYPVAAAGLEASLAGFPWNEDAARRRDDFWDLFRMSKSRTLKDVGWPFDRLAAARSPQTISSRDGWLGGMLIGAWTLALFQRIDSSHSHDDGLACAFALITLGPILIRLFHYLAGARPPISIAGRIVTGRWIIPSYDRVFVAPLAAAFVLAIVGSYVASGGASPWLVALGAAVISVICFNGGPTLDEFRLTSQARLTPLSTNQTRQRPPRK